MVLRLREVAEILHICGAGRDKEDAMRSGGTVSKAVGQRVGPVRLDQDPLTIVRDIGKARSKKPPANLSEFKKIAGKTGLKVPTMFAASAAGALGGFLPGPQLAAAVLNALCKQGEYAKAGKVLQEIMFA